MFPTFKPGKYSQASTSAPSKSWIHQAEQEKGVLVNTPTFTWAYTRTFKEREIEEILNSIDTDSFSNQTGCCFS
jgi:lantibiotic modifying enzyme